jgi:hypothetical protein
MKKIALISLAAFLLAFTGCAKEDDTQADNSVTAPKTTTTKAVTTTTKPAEIVEYEMTYHTYTVLKAVNPYQLGTPEETFCTVIFEYQNTGNVPIHFSPYEFHIEDENGTKTLFNTEKNDFDIKYQASTPSVLEVNQKGYFYAIIDVTKIPEITQDTPLTFKIKNSPQKATKTFNAFEVSSGNVSVTETGLTFSGVIKNTRDEFFETSQIHFYSVVFDKDSKPIGVLRNLKYLSLDKDEIGLNETQNVNIDIENIAQYNGQMSIIYNIFDKYSIRIYKL